MKYPLLLFAICGAALAAQSNSDKAWDVLKKGLTDKSIGARVRATNALGALIHDRRAQAEAEKLLDEENPKVRAAAALALGNMDARSSADKIAVLFDHSSFTEVLAAAKALHRMDDPRAFRVYYATLTGQKKTGQGLIESQMKILRDPKALDALISALTDKKWLVRAMAAEAIGQRDDPSLKDSLPALFSDTEDTVRYASAAAYLRLASVDAQQPASTKELRHQTYKWSRDEELLHRLARLLHSF